MTDKHVFQETLDDDFQQIHTILAHEQLLGIQENALKYMFVSSPSNTPATQSKHSSLSISHQNILMVTTDPVGCDDVSVRKKKPNTPGRIL